jgi:serine/threonine-protein kinase
MIHSSNGLEAAICPANFSGTADAGQMPAGDSLASFDETRTDEQALKKTDRLLREHFAPLFGRDEDREPAESWPDVRSAVKLGGRYRIERLLGEGSFGLVYLAFDAKLQRQVAVKVPRIERLGSVAHWQQVLAEARHAAALDHPRIIRVYEVLDEGPLTAIVTSYCDGPTLADWSQSQGMRLPPRVAAAILKETASGVDHAHRRGVLHRDLKPTNILMHSTGEDAVPMITDFGLARRFDERDLPSRGLCGTLPYMAPEVLLSRGRSESTASDIYSLGVLLCQLVTGRVPFATRASGNMDALAQAKLKPFASHIENAGAVPRDLRAIMVKCTAPVPEARYASAKELEHDLERFLAGVPVRARNVSRVERALAWSRREPQLAAAAALLLLITLAALVSISWLYAWERSAHELAARRAASLRGVLQDMSGTLADARLTNVPQMDKTRIALLQRSVSVYRQLARTEGESEQSLHDLSVALHRLANAYSQTGLETGRQLRSECLAIISKLRAAAPENLQYQYDEFMNLLILGCEWRGTDAVQAAAVTEKAYRVIGSLVAKEPDNEVYLDALAAASCDVATDLASNGRTQEAEALWRDAARRSRELWEAHPDKPLYLKHMCVAAEQLGSLAYNWNNLETAQQHYARAWDALEIMHRELPEERSLRSQRGNLLVKMASVSLGQGHFELADRQFYEAKDAWSALARDYPDAILVPEWIANANYSYAQWLVKANRATEAQGCFQDALDQMELLVEKHPEITRLRDRLELYRSDATLAGALPPILGPASGM